MPKWRQYVPKTESHLSHNKMPCRTWNHIPVLETPELLGWWRKSTILNSIIISATCWLRGFWAWMLVLSSPNIMVSWSWKRISAFSKSSKLYRVELGSHAYMSRVHFPVITWQLTTFRLWKRVYSMLQPWGWSRKTRPTPSFTSSAAVVISCSHTTLYPILLQQ